MRGRVVHPEQVQPIEDRERIDAEPAQRVEDDADRLDGFPRIVERQRAAFGVFEGFRHLETIVPGKLDNLDNENGRVHIVFMNSLDNWPTEAEAAALLQTSVKTISRYAEAGKVELRKRPRAGKKPENVVNPRDIEKLLPAAHVMPEERPGAVALRPKTQPQQPEAAAFFAFIQTITTAIETQRGIVQIAKPWLSLEDAAEATGLSAGYLRRQIADAKIVATYGGPRGAIRIQRASLEAFAG